MCKHTQTCGIMRYDRFCEGKEQKDNKKEHSGLSLYGIFRRGEI